MQKVVGSNPITRSLSFLGDVGLRPTSRAGPGNQEDFFSFIDFDDGCGHRR